MQCGCSAKKVEPAAYFCAFFKNKKLVEDCVYGKSDAARKKL